MTAIPSFPLTCIALIALGVFSIVSGCKDQEEPRTQSGEPIPFGHLATLPGDHPPIPANAEPGQGNADRSQAVRPARSIKATVKLSPALVGKTAPTDTVYIFARAAQGSKMPLAIVRKQVRELPVSVTLDDSMAMVPDMKMSSVAELVIGARISKSGDAIPKPGDLEGYAPPLQAGTTGAVEITIASVVGSTAPPLSGKRPAAADFKHAKSGVKTRLDIPADVKAKWKTVELSVAGKDIGPRKLQIPVGGETGIDKSDLTVRVVAYVPAFQSDAGAVTSASNSPDNPAVLIQLVDKGQVLNEGWVFQKLPDFNTYSSDKLQVQLLAAGS